MSNQDMTLSEFIMKTTADIKQNDEWLVEVPLAKSDHAGKVFVSECNSEYEAKERAYLWLQDQIESKSNDNGESN